MAGAAAGLISSGPLASAPVDPSVGAGRFVLSIAPDFSSFLAHFGSFTHCGSCHGPASLNWQPPSHAHFPPNSLGRFSAGTCASSSFSYPLPRIWILLTVTGSRNRLTTLKTPEKPHGALITYSLPRR